MVSLSQVRSSISFRRMPVYHATDSYNRHWSSGAFSTSRSNCSATFLRMFLFSGTFGMTTLGATGMSRWSAAQRRATPAGGMATERGAPPLPAHRQAAGVAGGRARPASLRLPALPI